MTGVLAVLVRRAIGPRPEGARLAKIAAATAAMAVALHLLRGAGLAVLIPAGLAVYALALAVTRVLSAEEIARVRSDLATRDAPR